MTQLAQEDYDLLHYCLVYREDLYDKLSNVLNNSKTKTGISNERLASNARKVI